MPKISIVGNVQADLLVSPVADLPPPGTDRLVQNMELRVAGNGGNAALTLAHLGCLPLLAGSVGDDGFGRLVLEELSGAGLTSYVRVIPGKLTGVSVVLEAPQRDRCFLTHLGSMASFDSSMVPRVAVEARLVLLCGYFNLPALQGHPSLDLLRTIQAAGGTTFFDCGWDPGGWSSDTHRQVMDLLHYVDFFLPNEVEACRLGRSGDPLKAARKLQGTSGGWILVKLGPEGGLAVGPKGETYYAKAPTVCVSDSTGAGDAFNAGLLQSLSSGRGMPEALDFATRVASTVVSRPSANRYPSLAEILPSANGD
jgi:sugar/nucleoside kinase (ribokinase family)